MDRTVFDDCMNGVFAAFQKPAPRAAVLDEAFKPVADYPDDFIYWAADKLKEEEKLTVNLGRELKRMWPAYKAETTPAAPYDPLASDCAGDPNCPDCHGKGWFYVWRKGASAGTAETAIPCLCNTVVDSWEKPPRKASLEDLRRTGVWTFHRPPQIRNGDPTPLGFSLKQLLDRLRQGRGLDDEPKDPRREMPEYLQ